MNGVRFTKRAKSKSDIKVLTIDEQNKLIEVARWSRNRDQYTLIMETGIRTGELIGLTWDSIDFKKKTLTIDKTLEYKDRLTGRTMYLNMKDLVFVSPRTGMPTKNSTYILYAIET